MKKIKLSKKTIFWIVVGIAIAFIITAIILTIFGSSEFSEQSRNIKDIMEGKVPRPEGGVPSLDVPIFTYGIFCWIMSLLTLVAVGLYGNSVFNKKYKDLN